MHLKCTGPQRLSQETLALGAGSAQEQAGTEGPMHSTEQQR